jgi:formamidopyrimidine-DNA glycosylase
MPELPELEALRRDLEERAVGQALARCELASISALKTFEPPLSTLLGRRLSSVSRRGKYLCLAFGPAEPAAGGTPSVADGTSGPLPAGADGEETWWLVFHLARGGWVRWHDRLPATKARPARGPLALRVGLESGAGFDITEMGTQKRLALWVVRDPLEVPQVASLGPDPLVPPLDAETLDALLEGRTATLKTVLADQRVLAGIGNAYSDEILHEAGLSPFRSAAKTTEVERKRLLEAIGRVLESAVERSLGQAAADLKREKKEGLRVHGRTGEPCPACSDTIREVSFADRSFQYCPTCQTGGKVLADRRLSRLLK